ncbi:MAG: hypothetical protein IT210_24525 [Armatimonadetes bacterium]|nr:hypothetical protein [Armatimonadota bacterium]
MELSRFCIPYTPFRGDLAKSKVLLFTTAGLYMKDDQPFNPEGDITLRTVPADVNVADIRIIHEHYDHSDADRDVNCVFPIERFREMAAEGVIGGLTSEHYTMGFTQAFRQVRDELLPDLAKRIERQRADLVFLTAG